MNYFSGMNFSDQKQVKNKGKLIKMGVMGTAKSFPGPHHTLQKMAQGCTARMLVGAQHPGKRILKMCGEVNHGQATILL